MERLAGEPLVSVITGTWGRWQTLKDRALASISAQTYPRIEHIIVIDGISESLRSLILGAGYSEQPGAMRRVVSLGRNWTQPYANDSNAAIARLTGTYLARGDVIGVLDDDNIWDPEHVGEMVARFAESGADMVCSDFNHMGRVAGGPPRTGNVDSSSFMVRWEALTRSNWQPDGYECDGHLAERLLAAGCTWAAKPGATMTITEQRHGAPD